ncbi:hypothetical protein HB662_09205 [Roseomonas frigidaquae]|uniref:Uncharacterized protein n=1 Tax=Falsiroseomonas frigidaquae TaxID=487318 RepID=A0ABX1EXX4_9PROT|nr:hypothetical protein [Falsiroseomonas frigidaquae]NKE44955.1 hypothetical protein [Falsiroseomonas frigidaquae]
MTRQAIADLLMAGAVALMLVAMWHLLQAMAATFRAMRAGHGGAWLLWDAPRFHDADRAPPAARPHVRAVMARFHRLWPWALAAMALAIPAAILAPA